MIYHLTLISEGCSDIGQYFIDSSRLDLTNQDHVEFMKFLVTAANDPMKNIELYGEANVELIDDVMFSGGVMIKPPCFVSEAVTFYTR
jgi:hypothetical protein